MISEATLNFLSDLSHNNDRVWFSANKFRYEAAKLEVINFSTVLLNEIKAIDPNVPSSLNGKNLVFRIYRDIRFSKDKSPYKTHFGIWIPAHIRKGEGPGYYLHIQPGNSFLGAGFWRPITADVRLIRQEIDYNSEYFLSIIEKSYFKNNYVFNWSESLIKAPKDYAHDHPLLSFLKLKSFEVRADLADAALVDKDFVDLVLNLFKEVKEYVQFLNTALED